MGASVHKVFSERLADMMSQSQQVSQAESTTNTQRIWMVPEDWSGDVFDIAGMHQPSFDRAEINGEYETVCGGNGNVGDAGSLKVQIDVVSGMERAFRFRHASHIRCVQHAAARHAGHGNGQGVFGAIRNYAQDLIKAAGEG